MSLNITFTQTIDSIKVEGDVVTSSDSPRMIIWNRNFQFLNTNGTPVNAWKINSTIRKNSKVTFADLDTQSQSTYSKTYENCSSIEAKQIRKTVFGNLWKPLLKADNDITISDSDIDSLVDTILSAD
tara:strand:- start:238 stop:618 length:381 start_codon:yes stop_codon:yes gene_type:complete